MAASDVQKITVGATAVFTILQGISVYFLSNMNEKLDEAYKTSLENRILMEAVSATANSGLLRLEAGLGGLQKESDEHEDRIHELNQTASMVGPLQDEMTRVWTELRAVRSKVQELETKYALLQDAVNDQKKP